MESEDGTGLPEAWAVAAAQMPLAFAQVREDPGLDVELAQQIAPGGEVVMIASGGETAVQLGRLPLKRLHLVDMNQSQLSLARCKWHLAQSTTSEAASALLGHERMEPAVRSWALEDLFDGLGIRPDEFGPPDRIAELGLDHAGRYEFAFAELRRALEPWREEVFRWLNSPVCFVNELSPATILDQAMDAVFSRIMALPNLVALFGEAATRNPLRPFHQHFAWRTRETTAVIPPATNPFLWQIFAGRFPPGHLYDWLAHDRFGQPFEVEPVWHHGRMDEVLGAMPSRSADLVHLSNILDWLSPEDAATTLTSAFRVLRPGGRVIVRQLNSTLDIPGLPGGLVWDTALGESMVRRDRSFFYPQIHVGRRP